MDDKVTAYIDRQPSPQREICNTLRGIIRETFPDIFEQMKLGVPYYDNDFYILALKDHVNLGISLKNLTVQQISQLQGGGKTMRCLLFTTPDDIDEAKISEPLKSAKVVAWNYITLFRESLKNLRP